ncbi:helix-turn-helix domain-containing protein [Lactiplantibacillus sp. WILCCON 0030]|uniref:Helix-turn-helix domain-containing protein n=1 Tax=Lactiplantibacillus brownii TaxID=3069269 RepID=A0ABU1AC63_9LACO|nr:helix-turn-helix domain-containing protein [Lactiplantibacillus brownii]MDQ7938567.1 helix-turn-helix domain-containing protein [Lactiplantibacillus brownii]
MQLQEMLRIRRQQRGLTQVQLARQLFVTTQAVSKWKTGKAVPSIDNLLALSGFYNVSLDELIQGSPFFKKPYLVGKRFSFGRAISLGLFWLAVSLLFTGFGTQPWWLFVAIMGFGIVVVLPVAVDDYWVITHDGLVLNHYATTIWAKFKQVLRHPTQTVICYDQLQTVTLHYRVRQRVSPFDINPDYFQLVLTTATMTRTLALNAQVDQYLPQLVNYLTRNGVQVNDDQAVLPVIISGQSLYEHFHTT